LENIVQEEQNLFDGCLIARHQVLPAFGRQLAPVERQRLFLPGALDWPEAVS
jgi:hypothetical protein